MKKFLSYLMIINCLIACKSNPEPNPSEESVNEFDPPIVQKLTISQFIDVSETSSESFLLLTEPINKESLLAYFPDDVNDSCHLQNNEPDFNLNDNYDALHFSKREGNLVEVSKISLNVDSILDPGVGYSSKPLSSLQKDAGGKIIFTKIAGDNNDIPLIYGENDVRDLPINPNTDPNPAFGINLNVQDAYLVLVIEETPQITHNLHLMYKASNSSDACTNVGNNEIIYYFNGCRLNDNNSRLYTKCK